MSAATKGLKNSGAKGLTVLLLFPYLADPYFSQNQFAQFFNVKRYAFARDSIEPQLASKQAAVDQVKALAQLKLNQVEALHVRAGFTGVLQQLPLEVGQRVIPGANLARVADIEQRKTNEMIGAELGYRYVDSPIIDNIPGGPEHLFREYHPTTWPGARLPHVWMPDASDTRPG